MEDFKSFIEAVNKLNEILRPYQSDSSPAMPDGLKDQIRKLSTYVPSLVRKPFLD
jgi:hypothetical protein